jgi:hypothetical protein
MINTELSSITANSKLNPRPELSANFRDIGIRRSIPRQDGRSLTATLSVLLIEPS